MSGLSNSSFFATKKTGRPSQAPTANGSRKLRWFEARITPPSFGRCSRPINEMRK